MNGVDNIILCQPDELKGCSVCCGLFNMRDTGRDTLERFLAGGYEREKSFRVYEEYDEPGEVRDRFSHICPYQGFLSAGKPGCLIHPLSSGVEGRDRSLFASTVCGNFLCPAHEILTAEEKRALINHVNDWYLYSTAIADPDSFSFIYKYWLELNRKKGKTTAEAINAGLSAHSRNLELYKGIIFFYSIPEYNNNKNNFSLSSREGFRSAVVEAMDRCYSGAELNSPE